MLASLLGLILSIPGLVLGPRIGLRSNHSLVMAARDWKQSRVKLIFCYTAEAH